MSTNRKKLLAVIIIAIFLVNLVSFFHAYKFTHFDEESKVRTDPKKLNSFEKIKTLVFGIDNPRPLNTDKPSKPYETVNITYKNDFIECWIVPVDSAKGTVLIFHGYAGNKSQMVKESNQFNELGYSTVLIDFLGSGGSTGNKTTIGFYESEQVKYAYDYFKDNQEQRIIMFGTSMGSVAMMKSIYDYNLEPESIILECPFGDMLKTVQARFRIMNAPTFPMSHLLTFWGGFQNNFNAFAHNPSKYAKGIKVKTLLMYGMKDDRVSKEETDLIFKNLQGPKELKLYPNAGHESILSKYRSEWIGNVLTFLE